MGVLYNLEVKYMGVLYNLVPVNEVWAGRAQKVPGGIYVLSNPRSGKITDSRVWYYENNATAKRRLCLMEAGPC